MTDIETLRAERAKLLARINTAQGGNSNDVVDVVDMSRRIAILAASLDPAERWSWWVGRRTLHIAEGDALAMLEALEAAHEAREPITVYRDGKRISTSGIRALCAGLGVVLRSGGAS